MAQLTPCSRKQFSNTTEITQVQAANEIQINEHQIMSVLFIYFYVYLSQVYLCIPVNFTIKNRADI